MPYSLSVLTTQIECDSLLTLSQRERNNLAYRKTTLERQKLSFSENSTGVDQDLAAVTAEVNALRILIPTLPDSPTKKESEDKLVRAETRLHFLSRRDQNYSNVSLLTLELDIARVQKEMDEVDAFILDVTTQKATL